MVSHPSEQRPLAGDPGSGQKLPAYVDFAHALIVRLGMVIICKPPAVGLTALRAMGCGNGGKGGAETLCVNMGVVLGVYMRIYG